MSWLCRKPIRDRNVVEKGSVLTAGEASRIGGRGWTAGADRDADGARFAGRRKRGEITGELLEFIMAIDEYKRINERPFPSWSEVFEIIQYLGYRKVASRAEHINTASGAEVLASPGSACGIDD